MPAFKVASHRTNDILGLLGRKIQTKKSVFEDIVHIFGWMQALKPENARKSSIFRNAAELVNEPQMREIHAKCVILGGSILCCQLCFTCATKVKTNVSKNSNCN